MSEEKSEAKLKQTLLSIARNNKAAQAYILEGKDAKELLDAAKSFAKALGTSDADTIFPEREKPHLLSVADIRAGIVGSVSIRPYDSPYKVYIVEHASEMNVQAQNALLKTLEEPPEYVIILLLTDNSELFLPTVLSRCVKLSEEESENGAEEDREELLRAAQLTDEVFQNAASLNTEKVLQYTAEFVKLKALGTGILDRFLSWYRDILLCKMGGSLSGDTSEKRRNAAFYLSGKMSFEGINRCITAVQDTRKRLEANVNTEMCFEVLLMELLKALERPAERR